jgi:hypothetical protein
MLLRSTWTAVLLLAAVAHAAEPASLSVFPTTIRLEGPRDQQRLVVIGAGGDLTRSAHYVSSAPKVVTVDQGGIVRSTGDGQAVITVTAGGLSASVTVEAKRATADIPVNFNREVVPILTKAGCNSGACHGTQHGRGGFKLSLRGSDAAFDHPQIVQSAEGRRVVLSDPERSIFLAKPAGVMEHGGGERLPLGSRAYETLRRWLEDGAPEPLAKDASVVDMEVWPAKRLMGKGEQQQIAVSARWSDGRVEDVTDTAQFDSLNEAVASVSAGGLVTAKGLGETHVMVRFCGQAKVMQVTLPFTRLAQYPQVQSHNLIDDKLIAKWKDLGLTPSPLASDEEFFRRIHLDTIGTLPAPADITAFLADKSADKRAKAIDRVLERPEFYDFWALKWGDLLRINRQFLQIKGMFSFHNWVRSALRDNMPVDQFVREVLTAEGSTYTDGPANYYRLGGNAPDWAETTVQIFLGVRLQCAKCHQHPFEKWTQDDYYGMAAFFARIGTKSTRDFGMFDSDTVVFLRSGGEVSHPRKGGTIKPHPLDGPEMDDPIDRRVKLAEWLTAPTNAFLAPNLINRFWGYYMGRGLVEPLDDLRATNPASNPELLDALAKDFIAHKFDFKHLLRTMMNSRAYQLSSTMVPGNDADKGNVYFARYGVKRLTAEQLADALDFATGTQEKYAGLPAGTRAIQLPDTAVRSYLMDIFGRPGRKITCECERTVQPNISQALHLLNGEFLNQKIGANNGRIEKLIKAKTQPEGIVHELYMVTLSRPPHKEETARALAWLAKAPSPTEGAQDLLWTLLNSREFLFNH